MLTKRLSRPKTALLAGLLLLAACSPTPGATALPEPSATPVPQPSALPTVTVEPPTVTAAPSETSAPTATSAPAADGAPQLTLETGSLASGIQTENVPAVADPANAPYWEVLPAYTRVTLQGYPITSHMMKPQIFVYPLQELEAVNQGAGDIVATLRELLQSPQEKKNMPFLPLFNAAQVLHTQVQYLDFKNGQGLRYLTQFDQAMMPVNNNELFYTYQGLTSDGRYYVAAVLPVNHPNLPADGTVTGNEPPEFSSDFPTYLANLAQSLNVQPANSFTPDLTQLDAMLASLEIK